AAGQTERAGNLIEALMTTSERAEALELEIELARQDKAGNLEEPLRTLATEFPKSRWYARALHEAGDEALVAGYALATQRQFDQLVAAFQDSTFAPGAAWRAAWIAYRLGQASAPTRLEQYGARFPHSTDVVDSLYWRGEWALAKHEPQLAAACLHAAANHFPGTYFGQQAHDALAALKPQRPLRPLPAWLRRYQDDPPAPVAKPIPAAFRGDLERARSLQQAGLLEPAATIMASVLGKLPAAASLALARELAGVDYQRGAWHDGLEAMLHAAPKYLELHRGQLRVNDWRLLFPQPYRADVTAAADHFGLGRNLLLGLVRQESGFDPGSVSSTRAQGLTQLELATARGGYGRLPKAWRALAGAGVLSSADLANPGLNLALGAGELHALLQRFPAPEQALAGYNAGASRVVQWQQRFGDQDANAFIESIPFAQTRAYVQAVLRNQAHYRQIYAK
ncbi:MAG: transglycosylase SLT domain-containing protein, partial [Terriglobales bacterium]